MITDLFLSPQMQGHTNPRSGMGLSNASANGNVNVGVGTGVGRTVRRPLAPLDIEEGGDVKRMRM